MEKPSILIAIPCYGGIMSSRTTVGLVETARLFDKLDVKFNVLTVANQSLISLGRSDIANFFVNDTDFSHIMWIDSDIAFEPNDVMKLIDLREPYAVGAYSMKHPEGKYSFTVKSNNGAPIMHQSNKAVKVGRINGGFQLIHRLVYNEIAKSNKAPKYIPSSNSRQISEKTLNESYHYYHTVIDDKGYSLPEDFSFNDRWLSVDGDIWLRTDIDLGHVGSFEYRGAQLETIFDQLRSNDE